MHVCSGSGADVSVCAHTHPPLKEGGLAGELDVQVPTAVDTRRHLPHKRACVRAGSESRSGIRSPCEVPLTYLPHGLAHAQGGTKMPFKRIRSLDQMGGRAACRCWRPPTTVSHRASSWSGPASSIAPAIGSTPFGGLPPCASAAVPADTKAHACITCRQQPAFWRSVSGAERAAVTEIAEGVNS